MKRILVALLLTVGLVSTASSQPRGDRFHAPMDRPGGRFLQDLNLTESQQRQLDDLRDQMLKEQIANRSKLASERLELQRLLRTETPDEKAIAQKVADIASIQAAGKQIWIKHWFQVNKLLTAEQQKVWKRALQFAGRQAAARLMQERTDFPRGWRRR